MVRFGLRSATVLAYITSNMCTFFMFQLILGSNNSKLFYETSVCWGLHCGDFNRLRLQGPLGRPRRRWEDNMQMDLQEVGRGCGDWMGLAKDRDR